MLIVYRNPREWHWRRFWEQSWSGLAHSSSTSVSLLTRLARFTVPCRTYIKKLHHTFTKSGIAGWSGFCLILSQNHIVQMHTLYTKVADVQCDVYSKYILWFYVYKLKSWHAYFLSNFQGIKTRGLKKHHPHHTSNRHNQAAAIQSNFRHTRDLRWV